QAIDGDHQIKRGQARQMRGAAFVDIGQLAVIALLDGTRTQRRLAVLALVREGHAEWRQQLFKWNVIGAMDMAIEIALEADAADFLEQAQCLSLAYALPGTVNVAVKVPAVACPQSA